jgi:hypothetical protein
VKEVTEGKQFDLKADAHSKNIENIFYIFNPLPGRFFTGNKYLKFPFLLPPSPRSNVPRLFKG